MKDKIKAGVVQILDGLDDSIGLNWKDDPNFTETPERVTRAFLEMLDGTGGKDVEEMFSKTFPSNYKGMITMRSFQVYSMCPHHLLPVAYDVDISYMPNEKVIGASKLVRYVTHLAKRAVLQETLTEDIVDIFMEHVEPRGVMVVLRGKHMCMKCRGVQSPGAIMETSAVRGEYMEPSVRMEFLLLGVLNALNGGT